LEIEKRISIDKKKKKKEKKEEEGIDCL